MAMLIDENSCEGLLSELDLFSVPSTQVSVLNSPYKQYHPVNAVTGNAPLEFHITGGDEDFLDLYNSFLYLSFSIRRPDGTALSPPAGDAAPNESIVFPINYIASTLFKSIEVYLNGVQISTNDNLYAYRAFLETQLTYGSDVKNGFLQGAMFYQDTTDPDIHNATVATAACVNTGAHARYLQTEHSAEREMITKVHTPLFEQSKLLLNKMDLRVKFNRNDTKFCLMALTANTSYSISLSKASMYIRHKKISESVRESIESALISDKRVKYPLIHTDMKFFTRPQGQSDLSEYNIINGYLPKVVVVGLVRSDAFNGDQHRNPFNFSHFNLESISLRKNGEPLPFQSLDLRYDSNNYVMGYLSLHQSLGRLFSNNDLGFSLHDYKSNGLCLYAFDISQDGDGSDSCHTSTQSEGSLDLLIRAKEPINTSCTIIVYMQRDGILELDKDRVVSIE